MLNNLCENNPCPEGMECVADPRDTEYSCVCPEAKKGKCSGKTICDLDILSNIFCIYTAVMSYLYICSSCARWPLAHIQWKWLCEIPSDGE